MVKNFFQCFLTFALVNGFLTVAAYGNNMDIEADQKYEYVLDEYTKTSGQLTVNGSLAAAVGGFLAGAGGLADPIISTAGLGLAGLGVYMCAKSFTNMTFLANARKSGKNKQSSLNQNQKAYR